MSDPDTSSAPSAFAPDVLAKLLYTPREGASLLSLSRTKIYQLKSDGRLPFVLIDGSRRIPATALRDFISAQLERQGFLSDGSASVFKARRTGARKDREQAQQASQWGWVGLQAGERL